MKERQGKKGLAPIPSNQMDTYITAGQEAGKEFFLNFRNKGKVVMLNLLRFRKVADYKGLDEIKPEKEVSGEEAYGLYMKHTLPFLEEAGSRLLFKGKCSGFLIGPESEKWDLLLLVEHKSAEDFIKFANHEGYLKIAGHRTAALEDSRLLPVQG